MSPSLLCHLDSYPLVLFLHREENQIFMVANGHVLFSQKTSMYFPYALSTSQGNTTNFSLLIESHCNLGESFFLRQFLIK